MSDAVNHPKHYNSHPSGVECIDVVEHLSFNIGNAIKYLWRAGHKGSLLEDLRKAKWYAEREMSISDSVYAGCEGVRVKERLALFVKHEPNASIAEAVSLLGRFAVEGDFDSEDGNGLLKSAVAILDKLIAEAS